MSDKFVDPDDVTQPIRPRSPQKDQRQPYRYTPPSSTPSEQPLSPTINAQANRHSYQQSGQKANSVSSKRRSPQRSRGCLITSLVAILLLCILGSFTVTTTQRVLAFGTAISTQAPLSTQTSYMGISDRVNLLVMGYGGGTHDGANLTVSMVVMSILPQNHHTSLISVPRDLQIQYPPNSGNYTKINSVYELGSANGQHPIAGGDAAANKISLVTGLPVKYWLTIDFTGFRKLIDSIGGVDVYVPDAFTAQYPKNDDPSIDASWIKVHFDKGNQHMNGETAIRYARAREVLDNLAEGTDFARSARQQIIIKAVLSKVKQMS